MDRVGVEGTGSSGAGLARWPRVHGQAVVEVDRPDRPDRADRADRPGQGKADTPDAHAAPEPCGPARPPDPKAADGRVAMLRSQRELGPPLGGQGPHQAANQLRALLVTAPDGTACGPGLVGCRWPSWSPPRPAAARPGASHPDRRGQVRAALGRRPLLRLTEEITELDVQLQRRVATAAPALVAVKGVGTQTAAALLVAAGPGTTLSGCAAREGFAHPCGVAPIPAWSGKTTRHRLRRGGNREANSALYLTAVAAWPGTHRPAPT